MKYNLSNFELISEKLDRRMVGGFSSSFRASNWNDPRDEDGETNNCSGGNCKTGCGTGQNKDCNTVVGCGA